MKSDKKRKNEVHKKRAHFLGVKGYEPLLYAFSLAATTAPLRSILAGQTKEH
jgi:hypothetical protein